MKELYEFIKELYEGSAAIHDNESVDIMNSVFRKHGIDINNYDDGTDYQALSAEIQQRADSLAKAAVASGLERESYNLTELSWMLAGFPKE